MAYIQKVRRKKGNVYRVYIKKAGVKRVSKTFDTKRLAVQFVNSIEKFDGQNWEINAHSLTHLSK